MLRYLKQITFLILAVLIFSCNTSKKKENIKEVNYTIDISGISVLWTAYKFTDKVGVKGVFDKHDFLTKNEPESIETLLEKSKISIYTSSVNSGSEIRDPKLRAYFFKVFNTDTIRGEILQAKKGKGVLNLEMNSMTNKTEYTYSLENDTLVLSTHIDLMQWKGEEAMNTLNKECLELHTGLDGVSKLWPDVDVIIKLPVKKVVVTD